MNKMKKIYFVATTVPGNTGGAEIRDLNLLRALSKLEDAKVTAFFISTHGRENDKENLMRLHNLDYFIVSKPGRTIPRVAKSILWDRIPPFLNDFKVSELGDIFRKQCEKDMPDVVHLSQIHAYYIIKKHIGWLKSKGVKIFIDSHNVEYKLFNESLDIFPFAKKIAGKIMVSRLKKLEIEATKIADALLCCSELDAEFFSRYNSNVFVIPNGVDAKEFKVEKRNPGKNIIFMGGVAYPPNEDAVRFYLSEIHPLVTRRIPEAKLFAIGADKEWLEKNGFAKENVLPLGFVPEVLPYLVQANVGICPIRYGSGTRLKILTYMASGLPVVSTRKGAEGVGYIDGEDILLADTPEKFSSDIVRLLTDDVFAAEIGMNGTKFVSEKFDWGIIGEKLLQAYKQII